MRVHLTPPAPEPRPGFHWSVTPPTSASPGTRLLSGPGDLVGVMAGTVHLSGVAEPEHEAANWSHALGAFVVRGGSVRWE